MDTLSGTNIDSHSVELFVRYSKVFLEEMNSISNMLSFRSSMNVVCTCCVGEICMNKILFKPKVFLEIMRIHT